MNACFIAFEQAGPPIFALPLSLDGKFWLEYRIKRDR